MTIIGNLFSKDPKNQVDEKKDPDVIFLSLQRPLHTFDARCIPTFALGCGAEFNQLMKDGVQDLSQLSKTIKRWQVTSLQSWY